MNNQELRRKFQEYLFPSLAHSYNEPLWADHGEMQYLWDSQGKRYLDFFCGIVTVSVGHANPRVAGKVAAQAQRLNHASTLLPTEALVELAEKIAQITPGAGLTRSMFTNSGT